MTIQEVMRNHPHAGASVFVPPHPKETSSRRRDLVRVEKTVRGSHDESNVCSTAASAIDVASFTAINQ
jgi:hypothetical protein